MVSGSGREPESTYSWLAKQPAFESTVDALLLPGSPAPDEVMVQKMFFLFFFLFPFGTASAFRGPST